LDFTNALARRKMPGGRNGQRNRCGILGLRLGHTPHTRQINMAVLYLRVEVKEKAMLSGGVAAFGCYEHRAATKPRGKAVVKRKTDKIPEFLPT
jgi:hypothetical protein